jgi:hypothetical protein
LCGPQFYARPDTVIKKERHGNMSPKRNGGWNAWPVVAVLMWLGAAAPAAGQAGTEPRIWANVSTQGRFEAGSAWRWISDSLVRTRQGARALDFLGQQFTVTRELTPRSSVGVGYAYAAGFPDTGTLREHRFVQHYAWSGGSRPRVSLRSRVEERFVTGQGAMLLRVRQQVRVTWPLPVMRGLRGVAANDLVADKPSRTLGRASGLEWSFFRRRTR